MVDVNELEKQIENQPVVEPTPEPVPEPVPKPEEPVEEPTEESTPVEEPQPEEAKPKEVSGKKQSNIDAVEAYVEQLVNDLGVTSVGKVDGKKTIKYNGKKIARIGARSGFLFTVRFAMGDDKSSLRVKTEEDRTEITNKIRSFMEQC